MVVLVFSILEIKEIVLCLGISLPIYGFTNCNISTSGRVRRFIASGLCIFKCFMALSCFVFGGPGLHIGLENKWERSLLKCTRTCYCFGLYLDLFGVEHLVGLVKVHALQFLPIVVDLGGQSTRFSINEDIEIVL